MDPQKVLQTYSGLLSNRVDEIFDESFTSDATMEFKGKVFPSRTKICKFLRSIGDLYEQRFFNPRTCRPFFKREHNERLESEMDIATYLSPQNNSNALSSFPSTDEVESICNRIRLLCTDPVGNISKKRTMHSPESVPTSKRNKMEIDPEYTPTQDSIPKEIQLEVSEIKYIEATGFVNTHKFDGLDFMDSPIPTDNNPNSILKLAYIEDANKSTIQFVRVIYRDLRKLRRCKRKLFEFIN